MSDNVRPNTAADLFAILSRQRAAFLAAPSPSVAQRQNSLRRLEAAIRANQKSIVAAINADFGNRSAPETVLAEVSTLLTAIAHTRRHLAHWMRPQRRLVAISARPAGNRVEYAPIGVVGIIAPWNYPVLLTLGPLIDILAAGNRCMIKPSEFTPQTAALLIRLLSEAFPPEQVAVVQGDVDVAEAFCALAFDHLVFTGSTQIGRKIMRTAAQNLVPVTLELGGKSPVVVAPDFDPVKAARSVAVGKFFNAGQTCVSPDYALVPRSAATIFAHAVLARAEAMYPTVSGNPDYTSVISHRHYVRLTELVAEADAAGACVLRHPDQPRGNTRQFPPTVILDPPLDTRLMQEEIFGPILPVVSTDSIIEAINFINACPRPLALYVYAGDRTVQRQVLDHTLSGGVTINGTMLHVGQADLPFGGIGASGMGAYHGHEGFLRFSHARGIHMPGFVSGFERLTPPHGRAVRLLLRAMTGYH